ncbi:isoprenylcysteine carboxylmethyltransferase family protein [Vibrio sp. SCSIO 43136]|uniref:methyltransferase family protein n=1 Tax=Vibrio sp. SCSIO 43136 TaxID=2819101 RepID=UPI002074E1B1|nr:isoprenylcysteine carboxylmethyltransferase family protein [Vibrio sp. SCSIO 43136]USD64123.1 isoprenylcysteine carboxylmethyltransferase family protein [Vibrio sp. SCSIO 43136]
MSFLELKVPPVILFIVALLLIWWSASVPPSFLSTLVSLVIWFVAAWLGFSGVREFRRHQTTVNPHRPEQAATVVRTGVFARTRNPMYLALVLGQVATSIYYVNFYGVVIIAGFVWYMNRYQIRAEERALEKLYGDEYRTYCESVRRWV